MEYLFSYKYVDFRWCKAVAFCCLFAFFACGTLNALPNDPVHVKLTPLMGATFDNGDIIPDSDGVDMKLPVAIKTNRLPKTNEDLLFVLEQPGRILTKKLDGSGDAEVFLDISVDSDDEDLQLVMPLGTPAFGFPVRDYDERGLLGIAFHPKFSNGNNPNSGRFWLYYSANRRDTLCGTNFDVACTGEDEIDGENPPQNTTCQNVTDTGVGDEDDPGCVGLLAPSTPLNPTCPCNYNVDTNTYDLDGEGDGFGLINTAATLCPAGIPPTGGFDFSDDGFLPGESPIFCTTCSETPDVFSACNAFYARLAERNNDDDKDIDRDFVAQDMFPNCTWPDGDQPGGQRYTIEDNWSHDNVLDEFKYDANTGEITRVTRLLAIKHPFFNHDSVNNIFYDKDIKGAGKLLVFYGDGGFRDDTLHLAQDDDFFHGKLVTVDVDSPEWEDYNPGELDEDGDLIDEPQIAKFSDLPAEIAPLVKTAVKGVRNWAGLSKTKYKGQNIKFIGQPGQDTVETVFAFVDYDFEDPFNIGWPGWEGNFPGLQNRNSVKSGVEGFTIVIGDYKALVDYPLAVDYAVDRDLPYMEYYHNDLRTLDNDGNPIGEFRPDSTLGTPGDPRNIQGVVITGLGTCRHKCNVPELANSLIVSEWAFNTGIGFPDGFLNDPGLLLQVDIDLNLQKLHPFREVVIDNLENIRDGFSRVVPNDDPPPATLTVRQLFFVAMSEDTGQTELYLGIFNAVGPLTPDGAGAVFRIDPAD